MRRDQPNVSDTEAMQQACPMCHQPSGSPCVYVRPAMHDSRSRSADVQRRLSRVGTPTNIVHHDRRRVIIEARSREFDTQLNKEREESKQRQSWVSALSAIINS
jgi:hypothetical protein